MSYKTMIKSALRRMGYAIYSIPKAATERRSGSSYAQSHPNATLAPWLDDDAFMAAYAHAQEHTLVDLYRMYDLWSLVSETAKVGGDIVEIGVWRGGTGVMMAHRERLIGGGGTVYLCDTFSGVVKAGDDDSEYKGGEHSDTSLAHVNRLATTLGNAEFRTLIGIFPDETGASLTSQRIRLVHIDVDVYQSAKDCFEFVWDRVPSGGVIVFDDYGFVGCEGVTRCVDELRSRTDLLYMYNLNGHAVLVKR